MVPPIYWRRGVIAANTIAFGEGAILQKIPNVAYLSGHHLLFKLQQAEPEIRSFTWKKHFQI
jgi:hypothetical protein